MIKGPKNAIPTLRGWVSTKNSELLKSQKISQAQIDEWYGVAEPAPVVEEVIDVVYSSPTVEIVEEDEELDYDAMTRADLLEIAEASGIEFASARPSKQAIIDALEQLD